MLAVDVGVHHARLQRAGTEQGDQRDDLVEVSGTQLADQVLHAAGFELEHRRGAAGLRSSGTWLVVQGRSSRRKGFSGHCPHAFAIDRLQGPVDDGQGAQAQEIELHQADRFDIVLVELGDHRAAAGFAEQRREVGQGRGRDDHAAGMLAGVAGQALQGPGQVNDGARILFLLVALLQLRFVASSALSRVMPSSRGISLAIESTKP